MLEKDRYELVRLKTQIGKNDGKVAEMQKENAAQKEEIAALKAREKDLLSQIAKM